MRKRKTVIIVVVLVIGLLVCGWRFYPYDLSSIISVRKNEITSLACAMSVGGVENVKPYINTYELSELSPHNDDFEEIMEILDSSDYHQDFRNLLPWSVNSIGSDDSDKIRTASVLIVWGNGENECCFLSMTDERKVAVSSGAESGLKLYHPTNREMLNILSEYLQMHGTKK
jgi:hypothetical protein